MTQFHLAEGGKPSPHTAGRADIGEPGTGSRGHRSKSLFSDIGTDPERTEHGHTHPIIRTLADGRKVVEKTVPDETEAAEEVFAYELSKALGFDIVPQTERQGLKVRSQFIDGTLEEDYGDENGNIFNLMHKNPLTRQSAEEIYVLDKLTSNGDRHDQNLIIDKRGKLWGIDNGDAGEYDEYGSPYSFVDENGLSEKTISKVEHFLDTVSEKQFTEKYQGGKFALIESRAREIVDGNLER